MASPGGNTDVGATNPVLISAVSVGSIGGGSATITWTTNIAASTQLSWGPYQKQDQRTTETDLNPLVTSHSVTLTGLTVGKTYQFTALSRQNSGKDGQNNTVMDGYYASFYGSFGA